MNKDITKYFIRSYPVHKQKSTLILYMFFDVVLSESGLIKMIKDVIFNKYTIQNKYYRSSIYKFKRSNFYKQLKLELL